MEENILVEKIKDGYSAYEIAKEFKTSHSTIVYWLKKYKLRTKPCSKYELIDWNNIQNFYDGGNSWRDIMTKLNISHNALNWGVKNKKFITRSLSDSGKLMWKQGKIDRKIYRTLKHRKIMSKLGGYREHSGRSRGAYAIDSLGTKVWLQSSYEIECSKILNNLNINWIRPKPLSYDTSRKYYPDFYLIDFGIYLDPKNDYLEKVDKEKIDKVMIQNNVKIFIVSKINLTENFIKNLTACGEISRRA